MSVNKSETLNKTFVSTLVLANLATTFPMVIAGLLLIEISQSFGIEVGTANQVRAVASTASIAMGLLMSGLSVRFKHKSLYLVGVGLLCLSAFSISIAPTFLVMLAAFVIFGTGRATVQPIGRALVSRFSLQQRPKIMSYLFVGVASAFLVGTFLVNIISDWRLIFSFFLFPFTLVTLILALKGIPSTPESHTPSQQYQQAFRDVLLTKSALACLIGNVLWRMPANAVWNALGSSFYRQIFHVNKLFISIAYFVVAFISIVGSLTGGRVVNRFGRKRLTAFSALVIGVLIIFFVNVPDLWLSLIAWNVIGVFVGIIGTAYPSLALEQAPDFRGTMMSLSLLSTNLGQALGNALAGFLLLEFNYGVVSLLGIFSLIGALIFHFFTIELKSDSF